jgi:glycosyltransferase involved in cell wall biosynthesis
VPPEPLVTIALPVFNGADTIEKVGRYVLEQDYPNIELLISDNASTDATAEVCRELARSDSRVRYHRQPHNIGLINNFEWTKRHCSGEFLRWIGDTDEIAPNYVSRCLEVFRADPRLILVTTQIGYTDEHGRTASMRYDTDEMRSDDPVERLQRTLRLLTSSYLTIDPLYGMNRVAAVRPLIHRQMLRGDEVYATQLALAGPWGHVPEILAYRHRGRPDVSHLVTLLEVPWWHSRVRGLIEARRMLDVVNDAALTSVQKRRGRAAIGMFYFRRHWATFTQRARRLRGAVGNS